MLIGRVVAQELLTHRVRGGFRLYDSDPRVEPSHDFGVRRAEQFTWLRLWPGGICGTRSSGSSPTTKLKNSRGEMPMTVNG
jgi:hypothetical protein